MNREFLFLYNAIELGFSRKEKLHSFTTKNAYSSEFEIFTLGDFKRDYKTRLDSIILRFLVHSQLPHMRIRSMKFDFFDTVEKYAIDSLTKGLQLVRNRKIQFRIFVEKTSLNATFRPLYSIGLQRFRLIS